MFDLTGRVAIVTGGNGGIGLGMARGLAACGASIVVAGRNEEKSAAAVKELAALGAPAHAVAVDVTDEAGVSRMVETTLARCGRLDILVNNAGTNIRKPLQQYSLEEWRQVLDTNLTSAFLCCRAAYPAFKAAGRGKVINIGSIDGLRPPILDTYAYSSSKAAVHHLTRHLATKLAPRITVNAVAPGPFESKMMAATLDRFRDAIVASCPMRRIGEPDDMAGVAIYLASRAGDYVVGSTLIVDGGVTYARG